MASWFRVSVPTRSRRWLCAAPLLLPLLGGCASWVEPTSEASAGRDVAVARETPATPEDEAAIAAGIDARSLAVRRRLADADLAELNDWWKSRNIGDPHKYLLPPMLAQLSLSDDLNNEGGEPADDAAIWDIWLDLERGKSDLYHFRSVYDVRIFFLFRDRLPEEVEAAYRSMLANPRVFEWQEGGTENHISQQYLSGLALMDGSGFPVGSPHLLATNESWLRAELEKYLTIGQGEFHSSTYYGFTIGALLNLYDFAETPERRELARAALDWLATNLALRLSWGTAGGAESRGYDSQTWNSGASALAWVWWGSDDPAEIDRIAAEMSDKHSRLAIFAATSDYRPPEHLRSLARKTLPLPFQLHASHPAYYSYHADNQFWETFYVTDDYSLGTLIAPGRSYQVRGTINAQYATYKLVVRDPDGENNAVVSLGGTYHTPFATGRSPGDRYLQEKGATLYQLRLTDADREAEVPGRSHLVLPRGYGEPERLGDWYVWRIENVWLCARAWGDRVERLDPLADDETEHMALAAVGDNTAWITQVAQVSDYPDLDAIAAALEQTRVRYDAAAGELEYRSLAGDRLELIDTDARPLATARVNGEARPQQPTPVFNSPYVRQALHSGVLEVLHPDLGLWQLRLTPSQPSWTQEPPGAS